MVWWPCIAHRKLSGSKIDPCQTTTLLLLQQSHIIISFTELVCVLSMILQLWKKENVRSHHIRYCSAAGFARITETDHMFLLIEDTICGVGWAH